MGPDDDMTPVELAAVTLSCNTATSMAEWRAVLLAGLVLGWDLELMVSLARGFWTPQAFGEAIGVAVPVTTVPDRPRASRRRRSIIRLWLKALGPKRPGDDQ